VHCSAAMNKRRYDGRKLPAAASAGRRPSLRQLRVGEELRHAVSNILRQGACREPALQEVSIAVTEVRLSPDLREATVFVMPLGGANAAEVVIGLQRSSGFLRRLVARNVMPRYAPNLLFTLDGSFDQAERIAALLARPDVARDIHHGGTGSENRDDAG
jgi:ribosome-binding factor A